MVLPKLPKLPEGLPEELRDFRDMWVRSQALLAAVGSLPRDARLDSAIIAEKAEQFEKYIREGVM